MDYFFLEYSKNNPYQPSLHEKHTDEIDNFLSKNDIEGFKKKINLYFKKNIKKRENDIISNESAFISICFFFRLLQIHNSYILEIKENNIANRLILNRIGIFLMSQIYMFTRCQSWNVFCSFDQLLRDKKNGELSEMNQINSSEFIKLAKYSMEKYLSKDNYILNNFDPNKIINDNWEMEIISHFLNESIGKGNDKLKHYMRQVQNGFIHSNPNTIIPFFASQNNSELYYFDNPSGIREMKSDMLECTIWISGLIFIFKKIFNSFDLPIEDKKVLIRINNKWSEILQSRMVS